MNNLFVIAHPDDEVLGACGTILRLLGRGERVVVATISLRSKTREEGLKNKQENVHRLMGVSKAYFLDYEMMKFDKYDRYEMTKAIEDIILLEKPDVIYTHDNNDVHNDHRYLHQIVMEAAKLPLRATEKAHRISAIYTMEIPSSTDWGAGFIPNSYVEITEEAINFKCQLLLQYDGVVRPVPHPRNYESLRALARYRGGQCGCAYAEAFRIVFEVDAKED